jgi:hypothetical protein
MFCLTGYLFFLFVGLACGVELLFSWSGDKVIPDFCDFNAGDGIALFFVGEG